MGLATGNARRAREVVVDGAQDLRGATTGRTEIDCPQPAKGNSWAALEGSVHGVSAGPENPSSCTTPFFSFFFVCSALFGMGRPRILLFAWPLRPYICSPLYRVGTPAAPARKYCCCRVGGWGGGGQGVCAVLKRENARA